jgi:hypothetical protein
MSKSKTERSQWKGGIIVRHNADPMDSLTDQQKIFVIAYVANGGNADAAGRDAKLERPNELMDNHLIRQAIEIRRDTQIKTYGATQAWAVMNSLMSDAATPAQVRFQAARWTLEASGHGLAAIATALAMSKDGQKDQHEMSISELEATVERARSRLSGMKQIVSEVKSVDGALDVDAKDGQ